MILRRAVLGTIWFSCISLVAYAGIVVWPKWQRHRELIQFETVVGQLPRNVRADEVSLCVPDGYATFEIIGFQNRAGQDLEANLIAYQAGSVFYVLFFESARGAEFTSRVEVYRLGPPAPGYEPRTKWGHQEAEYRGDPMGYLGDFLSFLLGDDLPSHNFRYRLIYSDPPTG